MQEPREISYNEKKWVYQFSGSKRSKVMKEDHFCYVPLTESLKTLLSLEDVQAEILNPHGNTGGDLCDDSLRFKAHFLAV